MGILYIVPTETIYPDEIFKPIVMNGISFENYLISNHGKVFNKNTNRYLKWLKSSTGYWRVVLFKNGERHRFFVHRLMAKAFIPIPRELILAGHSEETLVINHIDGNPLHNELDNLEWTTIQGNTIHAFQIGLASNSTGEKSHLAKITNEDAILICEMISQGKRNKEISEELSNPGHVISEKTIQHVRSRECWTALSKNYIFPKLGKAIPNTLSDEDVRSICKLLEQKEFYDREIALRFGVSREHIRDIRNRKRRQDISRMYNF